MNQDMDQEIESKSSDQQRVWKALTNVVDPEIPVISLVDLGMISDVKVDEGRVTVRMLPTFAGCPALEVMRANIEAAVREAGFDDVQVDVVFDPPWSTDRITKAGLDKLKAFGLAPPQRCGSEGVSLSSLEKVKCPFCDSEYTHLESMFGPTLCRSIHYCNTCRQSFEQFKPV